METVMIALAVLLILAGLAAVWLLCALRSTRAGIHDAVDDIIGFAAEYRFYWTGNLKTVTFSQETLRLLSDCGIKADKRFISSAFRGNSELGGVNDIVLTVNALKDEGVVSQLTTRDGSTVLVRWKSRAVGVEKGITNIITIGSDITEMTTMRNTLERVKHNFREQSEYNTLSQINGSYGFFTANTQNDETFVRISNAENLFGFSSEEMITLDSFLKLFAKEETLSVQHSVNEFLNGLSDSLQIEASMKISDGIYHSFLIRCRKSSEVYDEIPDVVGVIIDISSLRGRKYSGDDAVGKDRITGLFNRNGFMKEGDDFLLRCRENNDSCVLICIQIERLQSIITLFGIDAADILTRTYAEAIVKLVPKDAVVGKVGVEDFAVLFRCGSCEEIDHLLKELAIVIENSCNNQYLPAVMKEQARFLAGACFYDQIDDITTLYNKASVTLFTGSRFSGNMCCYFDSSIEEKVAERDIVEQEIGEALKHDELELYYQPKIGLKSGEIVGVEALMRWNRGSRGMLMPEEFIHVAEEIGVITKLDEWGLKQACVQNRLWQKMGYKPIKVSVNMSQAQLYQTDVVNTIRTAIEESGLDPKYLEVEVTETMAIIDIERTISVLNEIKKLGVSISMDDFGTGYSSLSSLKTLPIDTIKIDKSLIYDIESNVTARHITKAILDLGKAMKLDILAEGVETDGQREILGELGCDIVQGFLYSRPQPAAVVERTFLIPLLQKKRDENK